MRRRDQTRRFRRRVVLLTIALTNLAWFLVLLFVLASCYLQP